jgi:hypothetical protein
MEKEKFSLWGACWTFLNKTSYWLRFTNRKRLKSFKNKHKGERCFIIGNGPSLRYEDLERLKVETTMVCNSFIKVFGDLSFTPTYYFAQDAGVVKENIELINNTKHIVRFIRSYYNKKRYPLKGIINFIVFDSKIGFSDDVVRGVYDAWTVTFSMMQFAVYMGFSEIYLLGIDFNYAKDNTEITTDCYFDRRLYNGKRYAAPPKPEVTIAGYEKAKQYCEAHNIKILNATRGGKLEVFERVDIDKIYL